MDSFECAIQIAAAPAVVIDTFWRPERWPSAAAHVRNVEIAYQDDNVQVLWFSVASDGRVDRFKSIRVLHRDSILFYQPAPPPFLEVHSGRWTFRATSEGTTVTVVHRVEVNVRAARVLPVCAGLDHDGVRQQLQSLITSNSLQTMRALKGLLETAQETTDDHSSVAAAAR